MEYFKGTFVTLALVLFTSSSALAMKKFEFVNCYKSAVFALEKGWGEGNDKSAQLALKDLGMLYIVASTYRGITSEQVGQYRKALQYSRDCNTFLEIALAGVEVPTFNENEKVGLCLHSEMPFRKILMELDINTSNLLKESSFKINNLQKAIHLNGKKCQDADKTLKYYALENLKDQISAVEDLYDDLRGIP